MEASYWGRRVVWASLLLSMVLGSFGLWGCRRENPSNFDRNLPPETYISLAPAESTQAYYQLHIYWNGSDDDGVVEFFEYSVTDSNKTPGEDTPEFSGYFKTTATDSVFKLQANNPQTLGHRFYVRAIDNEGKVDPTPAWSYFVAHDFNFPNVVFPSTIGRWTDRFGTEHRVDITSFDRNDPTDTIGVGGCIEYTWDGFDVDVGGSVEGFEFRLQGETAFRGGTPADTFFTRCFPNDFSGNDVIRVRAIDDAGARTTPDSVRSVVVNFNPITLIVDPLSLDEPIPLRAFVDDKGAVRPSGTTLANGFRAITFAYTGFDDPRDFNEDPDDPAVIGFSFRRIKNRGGSSFRTITTDQWNPYPAVNGFAREDARNLQSGDYLFLIRAQDQLGRWGEPDTVAVNINYTPFFVRANYFTPGGEERLLWDGFNEPVEITWPSNDDNPNPMQINFKATDVHNVENPDPLDFNDLVENEQGRIVEYRARINGSNDGFEEAPFMNVFVDKFLSVSTTVESGVVRPGLNTLELAARDDGGREIKQTVVFRVNFQE